MTLINSVSIITAFFGGMVALFAPCCITFLLPSYLANIFRERKKVMYMTLIFGMGISTILIPTALGIRAVGQIFQNFHTQTYIAGGIFMIILGTMELTGKKITIPMIHLSIDLNKKHDPFSVYTLGVFSGITTSCCTPVLAGVLTLSFLSPNFLWAAIAGFSYVAGMVVPLVILALLLEKINWTQIPALRGKTLNIGSKPTPITEVIAGILFIMVGIIFSTLALTGRISMGEMVPVTQTLNPLLLSLVDYVRNIPSGEYIFATLVIFFIVWLYRKGIHEN